MASVNKVILVGNLGADPETRYSTDGAAITNIRMATTDRWKDKGSGEMREQTEWHRVVFFGRLAEILRTDRGRCDHAQRLRIPVAVVVEPMNGAAENAECLTWPDVDPSPIDGPAQHALETVDRLFVVVVAVRRGLQALRARDRELEHRNASGRVLPGDQESDAERPEADGLVGWIDPEVDGLGCHLLLPFVDDVEAVNSVYRYPE